MLEKLWATRLLDSYRRDCYKRQRQFYFATEWFALNQKHPIPDVQFFYKVLCLWRRRICPKRMNFSCIDRFSIQGHRSKHRGKHLSRRAPPISSIRAPPISPCTRECQNREFRQVECNDGFSINPPNNRPVPSCRTMFKYPSPHGGSKARSDNRAPLGVLSSFLAYFLHSCSSLLAQSPLNVIPSRKKHLDGFRTRNPSLTRWTYIPLHYAAEWPIVAKLWTVIPKTDPPLEAQKHRSIRSFGGGKIGKKLRWR